MIRHLNQIKISDPVIGGNISLLRKYVNVASNDDFILLVSWLLGAARPHKPYAILNIFGESGSGKSTLIQVIKELLDPTQAVKRRPHSDTRNLFIAAKSNWILAYDNLSNISEVMSDALCNIATAGSHGARKLYTDDEEFVITVARPIILSGIPNIVQRNDLSDRCVMICVPPISANTRIDEDTFWTEFQRDKGLILAGLCAALSGAIKHLPDVHLLQMPRMADFGRWCYAAAMSNELPWTPEEFFSAYEKNRHAAIEIQLEDDPIAAAVIALINQCSEICGTAAEILVSLEKQECVTAQKKKSSWPGAPNKLREHLTRAASYLRSKGIEIEFDIRDSADNGKRKIKITNKVLKDKAMLDTIYHEVCGDDKTTDYVYDIEIQKIDDLSNAAKRINQKTIEDIVDNILADHEV